MGGAEPLRRSLVDNSLDTGGRLKPGAVGPDLGYPESHAPGDHIFPGNRLYAVKKGVKIHGFKKSGFQQQPVRRPQGHQRTVYPAYIGAEPHLPKSRIKDSKPELSQFI
ncbi:hypothetical protein AGMMS50233_07730 [Endomicrobiia bacterium]|nr:hypothetical protein AGMMS50233_07730 [Endomicrobiia bacterium]